MNSVGHQRDRVANLSDGGVFCTLTGSQCQTITGRVPDTLQRIPRLRNDVEFARSIERQDRGTEDQTGRRQRKHMVA
jgi:hypothetical protein